MKRVDILNGQFDPMTTEMVVETTFNQILHGRRGWVCTVNVAILMMMRRIPQLQFFVDQASIIVADGQPLIWVAPILGKKLPERIAGVDLVELLCERAALEQAGVYLLGATDKVVSAVVDHLQKSNPKLKIDSANGYFSDQEASGRASAVQASGARILFVGMGVPRQEKFIEQYWDQLGVDVAIGVGGSFDVLSGMRKRAPKWMQRSGLEWVFRLIQEPRRLFARYLVTNTKFIFLVCYDLIRKQR